MTKIYKCTPEDIADVMSFINEHWKRDHILSWSRPLMDWQYRDARNPELYNWILARQEGRLVGVLGYIPSVQFDHENTSKVLLWLALWKVVSENTDAGLGLRLLKSLRITEPNAAIGVLGVNPAHPPMYDSMGFQTGQLNHHVIFGKTENLQVASVPDGFAFPEVAGRDYALMEVSGEELLQKIEPVGQESWVNSRIKTPKYLYSRYVRHPLYRYRLFFLVARGQIKGILATRVASANGSNVLRIVDFCGERGSLAHAASSIRTLLAHEKLEYCDLLEFGFDTKELASAGFYQLRTGDGVVVPNLFEPFVRSVHNVLFAIKDFSGMDFVILRGDGDQDRPNQRTP